MLSLPYGVLTQVNYHVFHPKSTRKCPTSTFNTDDRKFPRNSVGPENISTLWKNWMSSWIPQIEILRRNHSGAPIRRFEGSLTCDIYVTFSFVFGSCDQGFHPVWSIGCHLLRLVREPTTCDYRPNPVITGRMAG